MKKIFIGLLLFVSCLSIFLFKPPKVMAYSEINYPYFENVTGSFYIERIGGSTDAQSDSVSVTLFDVFIYYSVYLNNFNEIVFSITEISYSISYVGNSTVVYDFNEFYDNANYNTFLTLEDISNIDYETFIDYYDLYLGVVVYADGGSNLQVEFTIANNTGNFELYFVTETTISPPETIILEVTPLVFDNKFSDFMYQAYISNSLPEPLDPNVDMWSWLAETIGGFMDFEIFPSFSIGAIFNIVISIALFLIFLKVFVGG